MKTMIVEGDLMKPIIIIGAGGVGKETAWIIEQINLENPTWNLLGFVDEDVKLHGSYINNHEVIGGLDFLKAYDKEVYVVCAISNYKVKKRIVSELISPNIKYANIIHPSVYISSTNSIGKGNIIYQGVIITCHVTIGDHIIISPKCGIGHESIIGDYASLLWSVNVSGNVKLEEGAFIGSGATIIQNKVVGKGATVGAGAVVVKDVLEGDTVMGVPAYSKNKC